MMQPAHTMRVGCVIVCLFQFSAANRQSYHTSDASSHKTRFEFAAGELNGGTVETMLTPARHKELIGATAKKPHVVFVLWDDFGWTGAGYHQQADDGGPAEIRTPTLNRLVANGIELDRSYVFYCCSPTRSAIQSGRNPIHVNVLNADPDVWSNESNPDSAGAGVARNMTTIAAKMVAGGYRTHYVGKADFGMATREHTPRGRGYHTSLSYFHHENSYWTQMDTGFCGGTDIVDLWVAEEDGYEGPAAKYVTHCPADYNRTTGDGCVAGSAATQADHGYEDRVFAGRVEQIIQNHPTPETTPLFLFWAPHLVHTSLMVPAPYLEDFDFMQPTDKQGEVWAHDPPNMTAIPQEGHTRQLYAAMVHYADTVLGEVVDLLVERQMWNDTLLVFSADNGGAIYGNGSAGGNNWPLRGGKGSLTEGGIRGCSFASGGWLPSAVRGTKYEGIVAVWDWYATFSELAGVDPTDARAAAAKLPPIDSISLVDVLVGRRDSKRYMVGEQESSSNALESRGVSGANGRTTLLLGTEPTDGFPLGSTVGGVIVADPNGSLWKLLVGLIKQACWTGPRFPNRTTDFVSSDAVVNCSAGGKLGCLYQLDVDPEERNDLGASPDQRDRVSAMHATIMSARTTAFNPVRGTTDPRACAAALARGGFWGPFVD